MSPNLICLIFLSKKMIIKLFEWQGKKLKKYIFYYIPTSVTALQSQFQKKGVIFFNFVNVKIDHETFKTYLQFKELFQIHANWNKVHKLKQGGTYYCVSCELGCYPSTSYFVIRSVEIPVLFSFLLLLLKKACYRTTHQAKKKPK